MAHQVLAGIAILAVGIIYGTDMFCAVVQRPAMARVTDSVLTTTMGEIHRYGDQRLKFPGALGLLSTVAAAVAATISGAGTAAIVAGFVAVGALLVWFVIYGRVSAPVNAQFTAAVDANQTPPNARALQVTWDSVINLRSVLQGVALLALYVSVTAAS